jgi:hypothetical protein
VLDFSTRSEGERGRKVWKRSDRTQGGGIEAETITRRHDDLRPHTIGLNLFGVSWRCLALKCLTEVKRATGHPSDLEAVAQLEALLEMKEQKPDKQTDR